MPVTAAIRDYAQKQAQKLTRVSSRITLMRFFLDKVKKKQNDPKSNQVTLKVEIPGKDVVVKEHAVDMYEAINASVDAALRHLRKKLKKKRTTSRKR